MDKETFENRLLVKINKLFKEKENIISNEIKTDTTINKPEINKTPPNQPQQRNMATDHRSHQPANTRSHSKPDIKKLSPKSKEKIKPIKYVKDFKDNNNTKFPSPNYQKFKGDNIGHYPLPGLIPLQNISSNQCSICGTQVNEHNKNYCLSNHRKFKGNVYCYKHLNE